MPEPHLRSFRIHAPLSLQPSVRELLLSEGFRFHEEPFSPVCFRLIEEPIALGSSLAAFFGYIYIQDRSSMLPPLALHPAPQEAVLDMCASPGSKTSFLGQLKEQQGLVLANEPNAQRLATLRANLQRLGLLNCATCSYEGQKLPLNAQSFDAIQLDPPCSGWGTVEKNPKVLQIWQGDKIKRLTGLQRALLRKAHEFLKPGGHLLYSTCTTNSAENEEQVRFAVEELGFSCEKIPAFPGFVFDEPWPGTLLVRGEESKAQGFFLARLSKTHDEPPAVPSSPPELPGYEISVDKERPPGRSLCIRDKVYFVPKICDAVVPEKFSWRAAYLGQLKGGRVQLQWRDKPYGHVQPSPSQDIILESPEDLKSLLQGQSRICPLASKTARLFFKDLPLGLVGIKNGRILASFR